MRIDKARVLEFIRARGDDARAAEAEQTLPDEVDTDRDAEVLAKLGVDMDDIGGNTL